MKSTEPHIMQFFPTPVYSILDNLIVEKMLPIAKKYLSDKSELTNAWNYKNTYKPDVGLEIHDDMKEFSDYIINKAREFTDILGFQPDNWKLNIFASEMTKGDHHGSHPHPNCIYSGILYLQVPEKSSPLMFIDPRNHAKFVLPRVKEYTHLNSPVAVVTPLPGLFLMWNSWIEHMVPPNETDGQRITLVFNLFK